MYDEYFYLAKPIAMISIGNRLSTTHVVLDLDIPFLHIWLLFF
jgi:hypothetical protein